MNGIKYNLDIRQGKPQKIKTHQWIKSAVKQTIAEIQFERYIKTTTDKKRCFLLLFTRKGNHLEPIQEKKSNKLDYKNKCSKKVRWTLNNTNI